MECSKRLEEVIGRIRPCGLLLDVGCDHGYVTIEALRRGKAARGIAADVVEGPLAAAAANVAAAGLSERIKLLRSDGLRAVEEQPDCIVIAGMGGRLMTEILQGQATDGRRQTPAEAAVAKRRAIALLRGASQLLLSPQSEVALVRRLLVETLELSIADEDMVEEDGKFYVLLDVRCPAAGNSDAGGSDAGSSAADKPDSGKSEIQTEEYWKLKQGETEHWSETEYLYGKRLLEKRSPVFLRWLKYQRQKKQMALSRAGAGQSAHAKAQTAALLQELETLNGLLRGH